MRQVLIFSLLLFFFSCNQQEDKLFLQRSSSHTNIKFNNVVVESDSINPLDMEFLYNGGGVAVGDFNNDGQQDLYFTASQTENKLYLNKGNLSFDDITGEAKVNGEGRWCNAASVVDINNDGLQDIYVCASIRKDPAKRTNLLYVNQGVNKSGVPVFKEMSMQYNLADTGFSVHAAFFDYDRDDDLDMYLVTTTLAQRNSTRFDGTTTENKTALADKLYRNEGSDSLGHPYFRDISKQAGIYDEGYGLGVAIADVNKDGWKDIYVSNDFFTSDQLYLNKGDGTFIESARSSFKHTSQNAMGTDIADINNDGLPDIITVDMNPEDNFRKKKNMSGMNYFITHSMLNSGMVLQYVRNTLQLNNGIIMPDSGKTAIPVFSDISFFSGVAETDWSWNPSLADFDNDGLKDLIITNGYPKDVTDHDFAKFRQHASESTPKKEILAQIPQIRISNYAYKNRNGLAFDDVTKEWGVDVPSFSNGAAYVDLDNDGDLDYVISNINQEAFVYENKTEKLLKSNYLKIKFLGPELNKAGIGTYVELYSSGGKKQVLENSPYRGYLSTIEDGLHFGLGNTSTVDSIMIAWPDGRSQLLKNIPANKSITVDHKNSFETDIQEEQIVPLFSNITEQAGVTYIHEEFDYVDFDDQKLLPHKLSQYGPSIAVGDIDNNGTDDVIIGAAASLNAQILLQQKNGRFTQKQLPPIEGKEVRMPEMMGMLLLDVDADGDLDLYTSSGSYEFHPETKNFQDRIYLNNGTGVFTYDSTALPINHTSKSCVKAADFDNDGDLDLFVGGRVKPKRYPEAVNSFILRNDTKDGKVLFTDVTSQIAPELDKFGLACDAVWTDFDNDGWMDLIVVGEWMPICFFKNNNGRFSNTTAQTGLQNAIGWWNSITAGDFDNDGDIDYIAGNLGLNSFFKASDKEPIQIYAGDFDEDQSYDAITTLYLPDSKGERREYPANVRDDMIKQMIRTRRKFASYREFGEADITKVLSEEERKKGQHLKANYLASAYIQNNGNNRFALKPLPVQAQLAPLYGMVAEDVNSDGLLDIVITGNDFSNEVTNGRYDALNGLLLLGRGNGNFASVNLQESGIYIPGDGKGLAALMNNNKLTLAATQNRNRLQLFSLKNSRPVLRFNDDDLVAWVHLKNGSKRKVEAYYGTSFLSQSSRFIILNESISHVEITNRKGEKRLVQNQQRK